MAEREELLLEVVARLRDEASQGVASLDAALQRLRAADVVDATKARTTFQQVGQEAVRMADTVRQALRRIELPPVDVSNLQRSLELIQRRADVATAHVRAERELEDLLRRQVQLQQQLVQAMQVHRTQLPTTLQQHLGRQLAEVQGQITAVQALLAPASPGTPSTPGVTPPTPGGSGAGVGFFGTSAGIRGLRGLVAPALATMAPEFAGPIFQTAQAARVGLAIGGAAGLAVAGVGAAIAGAAAYVQAIDAAAQSQAALNLAVKNFDVSGLRSQLGQAVGDLQLFEERSKTAAGSLINAFSRAFSFLTTGKDALARARERALAVASLYTDVERPASIARGRIAGLGAGLAESGVMRAEIEEALGLAADPTVLRRLGIEGAAEIRRGAGFEAERITQEMVLVERDRRVALQQVQTMIDAIRGGRRPEMEALRRSLTEQFPGVMATLPRDPSVAALEGLVPTIEGEFQARLLAMERERAVVRRQGRLSERAFQRALRQRAIGIAGERQFPQALERQEIVEAAEAFETAGWTRTADLGMTRYRANLSREAFEGLLPPEIAGRMQSLTVTEEDVQRVERIVEAYTRWAAHGAANLARVEAEAGEAYDVAIKVPKQLLEQRLREARREAAEREAALAVGADILATEQALGISMVDVRRGGLSLAARRIQAEQATVAGLERAYQLAREQQGFRDVDQAKDLEAQIRRARERRDAAERALVRDEQAFSEMTDPVEGLRRGLRDVADGKDRLGESMRGVAHLTADAMSAAMTDGFFAVMEGKFKDLGAIGAQVGRTFVMSFVDSLSRHATAHVASALEGLVGQVFGAPMWANGRRPPW